MRFENTQNVHKITNTHEVVCFCPLGEDYYSAYIEVEVIEPRFIPDYLDTDEFIDSLSGKHLIIEDLANDIANRFKEETEAEIVNVSAYVRNAKHSPVEVVVSL